MSICTCICVLTSEPALMPSLTLHSCVLCICNSHESYGELLYVYNFKINLFSVVGLFSKISESRYHFYRTLLHGYINFLFICCISFWRTKNPHESMEIIKERWYLMSPVGLFCVLRCRFCTLPRLNDRWPKIVSCPFRSSLWMPAKVGPSVESIKWKFLLSSTYSINYQFHSRSMIRPHLYVSNLKFSAYPVGFWRYTNVVFDLFMNSLTMDGIRETKRILIQWDRRLCS